MMFEVIKVSNGYVLILNKPGLLGGFQKPERFVFGNADDLMKKIRELVG